MKKRGIKYVFISLILVMAMLLTPVAPAIRLHQVTLLWETMTNVTPAQAQEPEGSTIYLPLLTTPPGPPAFEIMSPANGGTISGVMYFAVQPTDAETVESVTFKAGEADLGTDSDASDGFKVFLNASDLPAGALQLSAIGTGVSGEITKTITVNVLPNPPSSGTLDSQGGVLASEIGSIITFPPDSVPNGTNISVTEMTQEEVTQENGFDWDAMGVTFLGAQKIESTASFSQPLGVASAGFGNRVQPGQAVVNYRIAPDADGDGIDELIVVNTASVAPNGDVISDPVQQAQVASATVTSPSNRVTTRDLSGGLSGGIGTLLEIEASGFNPASILGNVATFRSSVDGSELEIPVFVQPNIDRDGLQTIFVPIPNLPLGAATVTLRNESTSSTVGPLNLTIEAAPSLSQSPEIIIDQTLVLADSALNELATLVVQEGISLPIDIVTAQSQLSEVRTYFQELSTDPTPEEQKILNTLAVMIENSNITDLLTLDGRSQAPSDMMQGLRDIATGMAILGAMFLTLAVIGTISLPLVILGVTLIAIAGGTFIGLGHNELYPSSSNGGGTTGMGAAPPPGGNGAGNVAGGAEGGLRSQSGGGLGLEPGRFVVKVFSSGFRTPFSGVTDAGGYFFIPLIPEAEPFTALAIDTVTGQTRSYSGSGPAIGESSFMFFDFFSEDDGSTPIEIGDVIVREIIPGETNVYSFSAEAGQAIYFDEQSASGTVRWRLLDQSGNRIFDEILADSDPGTHTLTEGGTYNIFVQSTAESVASYQFQLWDVPAPDEFSIAIGDVVSDGLPQAGAGNIETPGKLDIYTFEASAGQAVFFDLQSERNSNWQWQLVDSAGTVIFNRNLSSDGGRHILELGGTYTMIIGSSSSDETGTYQVQLWDASPDEFSIAIGDVVSDGVPEAGAGNIETPGKLDIYRFEATAGQAVFFDLQSPGNGSWQWQLVDSAGTVIFNERFTSDAGTHRLELGGTYTLSIGNQSRDRTGTYQFQLRDAGESNAFQINIGDVVSDGVPAPGAGNIEEPGSLDTYTFEATAGQVVYFDLQSEGNRNLLWKLVDFAGTVIFEQTLSSDVEAHTLELGGTYTMIIGNQSSDETGTYQFQLWDASPDEFSIAIGDVVSDGVPQAGAGNIETPGKLDIYTFEASAGQVVYFDSQLESNSNLFWELVDSAGTSIFRQNLSSDASGRTLELGGTYTMIVGNPSNEATGTYQLQLWDASPDEFSITIGDVVSDGVPQAGAGNIETPGKLDIYRFEATAGQEVFFDLQSENNGNLFWKLEDSAGTVIFDKHFSSDAGTHNLELGGTYTLSIGNQNSETTGTYQFQLRDTGQSNAFQINIGDVVSDGVPQVGAGNIETPGSLDTYTFEATAGQVVYFDLQEGFNDDWRWKLEDSQGTVIFNQRFRNDPGSFELELSGTYTMTVGNQNSDHTGTYQIELLAFRRSALAR